MQELIDRVVYLTIKEHDETHQDTIAPDELLRQLQTMDPSIPALTWKEAAARMYRKRSEEQRQEANELEGELKQLMHKT